VIAHLLEQIPYEVPKRKRVELPERDVSDDAPVPRVPLRSIPTQY